MKLYWTSAFPQKAASPGGAGRCNPCRFAALGLWSTALGPTDVAFGSLAAIFRWPSFIGEQKLTVFPCYASNMFELIDFRDWGSRICKFVSSTHPLSLLHSYKAVCQYMPGFIGKWLGTYVPLSPSIQWLDSRKGYGMLWNMVQHVDILLHICSPQNLYNNKWQDVSENMSQ